MPKKTWLLAGIFFFHFCAPQPKTPVTLPPVLVESKLAEAEAQYKKASLPFLKKAFEAFETLYAQPSLRRKVGPDYVRTAILIDAREKELGIIDNLYLDRALAVLKADPALAEFIPCSDLARAMLVKQKGQMGDVNIRLDWSENEAMFERNFDVLKNRAMTDEFVAYIFSTAYGYYESYFSNKKVDVSHYQTLYPESLLIRYRVATLPEENKDLLARLIERDADFFEAYYHLGNIALKERKLLEAERMYLKANAGIPESPQITIALASIYFATEEIEKSLEFYEKTLTISPDYREALLGKAICLSTIGKSAEAISTLETLIVRGNWLIGESYYWLAWNQHQLRRDEEAEANVEQAKSRLPTDTEVFSLSGLIAVQKGEWKRAEKDFKESLNHSPYNTDALLGLGKIYDHRTQWPESGASYESAAKAFGIKESIIQDRIREIKESSMDADRKARFIARKDGQLRTIEQSKAVAFYNAAVGYFNAGSKDKATELAVRAAAHPALKEKAEDLISRIRMLRAG
jgi:tetratricopeptide (TPR) repeat protein